ncbi:LOW QUALITY PROTEIN: hypothetical protein HID58_028916, partial [Brassica napus]
AWPVLEPGRESFFQMVDRGLDEYFQKFRKTGVFLTPSLGILVSYNLSRGVALETWRGTDPEFPREFVGEVYQGLLPGKAVVRSPSCLDVEFAFLFGSSSGCIEAVFPTLGQGFFRGTTPMEILKSKETGGSPVHLLGVAWYACSVPRNSSFDSPAYVTYQSCEPGRKMSLLSTNPDVGGDCPWLGILTPTVVEACFAVETRDQQWPKNAGFEVESWSRQIQRLRGSDLRIGLETRDCRKSDLRIGPGTSRNQGLQKDPKPAGTRNCRKSDLRIRPEPAGTSRNQVVIPVLDLVTSFGVVLSSLEEVFPAV